MPFWNNSPKQMSGHYNNPAVNKLDKSPIIGPIITQMTLKPVIQPNAINPIKTIGP
jgi:hypothetical protein